MRISRFLVLVAIAVGVVAGATAAPASAGGSNKGVDHVSATAEPVSCFTGQSLPCTPDAGRGDSNVLYVEQTEVAEGQFQFDTLRGTGITDDHFWTGMHVSAQCSTMYRFTGARVGTGLRDVNHDGTQEVGAPVSSFSEAQPVNTANRTIPGRHVDFHVPIASLFGIDEHTGVPQVGGFETPEDVFGYGEDMIALRMASGMTEQEAREEPFELDTVVPMFFEVACRYYSEVWAVRTWFVSDPTFVPLTLKFGTAEQPAGLELDEDPPEPVPGDGLVVGDAVTQAFLSVQLDPTDACRLRLSGVITTNGPTEVSYRFVDEAGVRSSQIFTADVDQTFNLMLDHYVDLPQDEAPDGGGFVAEEDGGIGGYAQEEGDNIQGTYMIEVAIPHHYESNVAGYNVEPCQPEPSNELGDGTLEGQTYEPTRS